MRKLEVLAYAGRKSRSGKNTLIADIVDIGGNLTIWNMLIMITRVKNGMQ